MFDPAQSESGARKMITTLVRRIAVTFAMLARRAADIMNCNLMALHAPQHYLVTQRVAGMRWRQRRVFNAGGH
jgi:hypothetical protein